MAAAGREMAAASPNDVAPYTEQVKNVGQVNVGELVVVRAIPPQGRQMIPGIRLGEDMILRVRAKIDNHRGEGPALDVGNFKVILQPHPREFLRFAVFRRPDGDGPAAAGAGGPAGGKRRRKATRRHKKRRSTRRRWFY